MILGMILKFTAKCVNMENSVHCFTRIYLERLCSGVHTLLCIGTQSFKEGNCKSYTHL